MKAHATYRVSVVFLAIPFLMARQEQNLPEYKQAKEIAQQLLIEGRNLLMKEVSEKGPAGATQACSAVAQDLARKHEGKGWRIRRVSEKLRNVADKPDSYETAVLKRFEGQKRAGQLSPESESAEVVSEGGRQYLRYMKPIMISGPLCLKCHGGPSDIAPDVKANLHKLYPNDQATGYQLQDLRGAVSVKIPVNP